MSRTTIHIHSVTFNGNLSKFSEYKVSYDVPSISFRYKKDISMERVIYFEKWSEFVDENRIPHKIDFRLVFRKKSEKLVSSPISITIESKQINSIASSQISLDNIFLEDVKASITYFIITNLGNPIELKGLKFYDLSFLSYKIDRNVFLVNEELVAKKISNIKLDDLKDESMREILPFYEIKQHNCIVKPMGYTYIENNLYIILEKFGESLKDHIERRELDNEKIRKIIFCVCFGLIHMHQHNYIHRDIKPGNIVVNKSGEAKLIDFGISRQLNEDDITSNIGTIKYVAPEVSSGKYDFRCDIYSLGVVILEMISDVSVEEFLNGKVLIDVPHITQVILLAILSPDPRKRPTLDELISMIMYGSFFLVPDICGYEKEVFINNGKRKYAEYVSLRENNYLSCFTDSYYRHLEEEGLFFHIGVLFSNFKNMEEACDFFYIGHILGDEYCSYSIDSLSRCELVVAHNAETMNNDMTKRFMSLPSNDFRTFLVTNPRDLKRNYYVVDKLICSSNAIASDYDSLELPENPLIENFFKFYLRANRKPNISDLKIDPVDLTNQLQSVSHKFREGNYIIMDCFHVIAILYCLGMKFDYLYYFATLKGNDEFIGNIIIMFGKKRDHKKAFHHLMKSQSSQSINVIASMHRGLDIGFADKLYVSKPVFSFPILFRLTNGSSLNLMKYYAFMSYLGNENVGPLTYVKYHTNDVHQDKLLSIIKSSGGVLKDEEYDLLMMYMMSGQFAKARESIKKIVSCGEINDVLIYNALLKYGDGDFYNGSINLQWAMNKSNSEAILVIGVLYLHGFRLPKDKKRGLELIKSIDTFNSYKELASLHLHGVYVEQNVELALKYLNEIVNSNHEKVKGALPLLNLYIQNIKEGYYYFQFLGEKYLFCSSIELMLSKDFVPYYDDEFQSHGVLAQNESFYLKHAEFQNPLAMFCYAHCLDSVDDAINWLEKSAQYEFDESFNDLAYLYFVYKSDLEKAKYYSEIGAKLGFYESQQILSAILLLIQGYEYYWAKMLLKPILMNVLLYQYRFECVNISSYLKHRTIEINNAMKKWESTFSKEDHISLYDKENKRNK